MRSAHTSISVLMSSFNVKAATTKEDRPFKTDSGIFFVIEFELSEVLIPYTSRMVI